MKKIICLFLVVMLIAGVVACTKPQGDTEGLMPYVNYYQTNLYSGETEALAVSIGIGQKESTYVIDGIVTDMQAFATLMVVPLKTEYLSQEYSFKLTGETGTLEGALTKEVFGTSYTAEIADSSALGVINSIDILKGEETITIALTDKTTGMISYLDALKIASQEYASLISSETAQGFEREICVKFVNDSKNASSPYYWYVAFVKSLDDYWAMLIDPSTGTVITKKS